MTSADLWEGDTLFDDGRPPYNVMTMAEVNAVPWNGLTAVSTFSGCGGSSMGLRMAGFKVPYAVEFIGPARDTYMHNSPSTYVDGRDIREVQPSDILDHLGIGVGELDLFEGSPPCSSFSIARRARGNIDETEGLVKLYSDGVKQRTDDLFDEWLRLVEGLQPRAVLAENVPALADAGPAAKFLHRITDDLDALGYNLHVQVYSSLWAGAATMRKRLIFLGIRKDVGPAIRPRLSGSGYNLREGLETLPVPNPQDELDWFTWSPTEDEIGRRWAETPKGDGHPTRFSTIRCSWDRPAFTFTATPGISAKSGGIMHPDECRHLTPHEAKWLSGFPIDFELLGTPGQRMERIGRAVTPVLYKELGPHIAAALHAGRA